jgi:hypothetical protein
VFAEIAYVDDCFARSIFSSSLVAVEKGAVIGFAHALSDGWWGYLSVLVVGEHRRHEGIGGRLIDAVFRHSGGVRLDLVTDEAGDFYRGRPHTAFEGFRLYRAPRSR